MLILAAEKFEDIELLYPYYRLKEEGFEVHIVSDKNVIAGKHGYSLKIHKKSMKLIQKNTMLL